MRRLLLIALALVATSTLAIFATGAGESDGEPYRVRAIFLNAFSIIPGEDVRIAGVKVGKISDTDVTKDRKAVVTLEITEPGFQDFRADAECSVRPQSLIGEKFVECTPTQPRAGGGPLPPPLKVIPDGQEGEGERLLPVTNTSKPVDLDLVNNTLRLPYRQRLAIILNELGTGLAARGPALKQAVRNANPALKETDRVIKLLAGQSKVLQDLATDGDRILGPLARDRAKVADFVTQAGTVARATAERSDALEQGIQRLPAFLRELRPTMDRLGSLSDEATPVLADARAAAPALAGFTRRLGPFAKASTPALARLGDALDVGRPALLASRPIIADARALARELRPVSVDLATALTSIRDTGGIERAMDYLFYQVAAINGFDSFGHYLRANLIVNNCTSYAVRPQPGCTASFAQGSTAPRAATAGSARADDAQRTPALVRQELVLAGMTKEEAYEAAPDREPAARPRQAAAPRTDGGGGAAPAASTDDASRGALLDYLLGGAG